MFLTINTNGTTSNTMKLIAAERTSDDDDDGSEGSLFKAGR